MNAPDFPSPLRIAPAALESESAVVGALLLDNSAFDRISDRLRPEHFSRTTTASCSPKSPASLAPASPPTW